jgi:hypothetical protein
MRILFPVLFGLALCAGSATAQSDDQGGAMGQLENATSGHQTLDQTYGDSTHGPGCPDECPTGNTNVPDASPPAPVDSGSGDDQKSRDDQKSSGDNGG